MGVEEGGRGVVCFDEEITHNLMFGMICDVHFGDTRYDLTPAIMKRLPNNHPEEQTTTPHPPDTAAFSLSTQLCLSNC